MNHLIRKSAKFALCCSLPLVLYACEKDSEVIGEVRRETVLDDFTAEYADKNRGRDVFAFSVCDSASLRKGRPPNGIRGFLPPDPGQGAREIAVFFSDRDHYEVAGDSAATFRYLGAGSDREGIFEFMYPEVLPPGYLKAVIVTEDSLHFSKAAFVSLTEKQTDYVSKGIEIDYSNGGEPLVNWAPYHLEHAVASLYSQSGSHLISLYTRRREALFFFQFDFEFTSKPEIKNPGLPEGTYILDLFFIDKKNRARSRARFHDFQIN